MGLETLGIKKKLYIYIYISEIAIKQSAYDIFLSLVGFFPFVTQKVLGNGLKKMIFLCLVLSGKYEIK